MAVLHTHHGDVTLPAFFPDATRGVVRGLDGADLGACGVPGLVVNAFHLAGRPGSRTVRGLGGVHAMIGWQRPIITDSGGFQIFSLIRQNPKLGTVTNKEALFRSPDGQKAQHLSPEKSIQTQFRLGADILVCLDDCTHPGDPLSEQSASVVRTIQWAERCKAEFERGLAQRCRAPGPPPLLFAVIQGGADPDLRRLCAKELIAIGFDGYAFGGWPFDAERRLLTTILALSCDLMPSDKPRYALGIGSPATLIACHRMGYNLFDCSLPTRDARRGRLYVFDSPGGLSYSRLYIRDAVHRRESAPLSGACDCLCCRSHSRAYLHHLFAIGDPLAWRLATIHNLRFYATLLGRLAADSPAPP